MENTRFNRSFEYKLIYIFRINDDSHKGFLKIGDATVKTEKNYLDLKENCKELNNAADFRIREYTVTAGILYELLHTEIATFKIDDKLDKRFGLVKAFRDHNVHEVLKRSGISNKGFILGKEWFKCDLKTAINGIKAVKSGKSSLLGNEISSNNSPVILRPEQEKAVKDTLKQFEKGSRMLWNAKMRFGKTLSALEVTKRSSFSRTIIITHRPVVEDGWFDDFKKIFYDREDYVFGSKNAGEKLENLIDSKKKFVYFTSMQDLRGSEQVGGKYDKNNLIFKIDWDFVVVDEAHEGTQTKLGQDVLQEVIKPNSGKISKTLELSGTPFNLLVDYGENEIYTWDYIMEQEAKKDWALKHFGDSNPYDELPKLNIYTFHLEETFKKFRDLEDKAFNFREFFRVWEGDIKKDGNHLPKEVRVGDFLHEQDVNSFLNLLTKESTSNNYPFSTELYRDYFRHSLLVVPGVKEAKALSNLLKKHKVFSQFEIVNVAGDGDEEIDISDALKAVRSAITKHPEETRTITITCGRLTTGVTVPEWTAVLMLSGSYSTAATQYLQTIFRVQSPANINGKIKENCYVFDFAPDRTLKMVAESVQLSQRGMGTKSAEVRLKEFLNFCPVISISNSVMQVYKVSELLQQLKKAYVERVVKNGFDDTKLYNDELLKLDNIQLKEFDNLKGIIGQTKALARTNEIDINDEGFTDEEYNKIDKIEKKDKKELSPEERKLLEEKKRRNKQKHEAISILRGISIRIPLLVYGADIPITKDISVEEFPNLVDEASWIEFMPKGVTKDLFLKFGKYYDKDIFVASTYRIRAAAKAADSLDPTERIHKITQLFSTFRNPDKETILTPWKVVNKHMSDTIGGYSFFDNENDIQLEVPRLISQVGVTEKIFSELGKVLELNSKTGLYPLYVTYTFYRNKIQSKELSTQEKLNLYDEVIKNNVFVICKTPMAKQITKRTLLGYRDGKINSHAFDDLVNQMKDKQKQFVDKISLKSFWDLNVKENTKVKFNAIVGNPPYQIMIDDNNMSRNVYHEFIKTAVALNPNFISLICPSKWMAGELGPYKEMKGFFEFLSKGNHLMSINDFTNSSDVFSGVDIKGGVCYFLYSPEYNGKLRYSLNDNNQLYLDERYIKPGETTLIRFSELVGVINKVQEKSTHFFSETVSSWNPYGFISDFFDKNKEKIRNNEKKLANDDVLIYGLSKSKRTHRFVSIKDVAKNQVGLKLFKVFITRANGSGIFGEKFSSPMIGKPMEICTDTFLEIGPFASEMEASACLKYVKTKFFRALVGAKKTGVFNYKDAFQYVPLLSFNSNREINWTKSLEEIDEQLFKHFNLNKNEISFIQQRVLEMI
jgi:superfamily II DNA or RNA helicase